MRVNLPIGVFDSGIGGLTVLRGLLKALPAERFVYFGDTARVPYGTKSPGVIRRYSLEIAQFLIRSNSRPAIKMLVIACNSASAAAAGLLKKSLPIPVVGVVEAGALSAARVAPRGTIAVIGTNATIASSVYLRHLRRYAPEAKVISRACPLFVPLVEEGWMNHPITGEVAHVYLGPLAKKKPDALILGCTHYPMILNAIKNAMGVSTAIIDCPTAVAQNVKDELTRRELQNQNEPSGPRANFFVSDDPRGFSRSARLFLGGRLPGPIKLARR